MRAVAVRQLRAAAELIEVPSPEPGPGEVAVRIAAAGMNPFDRKIADGVFEGKRRHVFPLVLGVDGAGLVEAIGPGPNRFKPGDRIVGSFLHDPVGIGTYAERSVIPQTNAVVVVPEGVGSDFAAALPTAGMTAVQALDRLRIRPGGTLALVGASGGIGSIAVQLARARGLRVVAIARPPSHERLRKLGADEVLDIGTRDALPVPRTPDAARFDGLLDVSSDPEGFARWARQLRPGSGAISTIGSARASDGLRAESISMQPTAHDLGRLLEEANRGTLRSPVERTIGLDEAPVVLEELRQGRAAGKTVIVP